MRGMTGFLRPELEGLREYAPDSEGFRVRLDGNESPFDFPADLKRAALHELMSVPFNRYPQRLATALREEIASWVGARPRQIVVGNGLDEVIHVLLLAYGRGRRVIVPRPWFSQYASATRIAGGILCEIPLGPSFQLDAARVIEEAGRDRCIVLLCNPHNPSGSVTSIDDIEAILRATQSLVVVDEAYWEFSGATALPLVESHDRLVVLRTLSKACGLAGVRVGFSVSSEEVASELSRVKQPFNMDSLALTVARIAVRNSEYSQRTVLAVKAERERLFRRLGEVRGIACYPSHANFILFRTDPDSDRVWQGLRRRGVAIRRFAGEPLLRGCLRVTCGTAAEDDAFIEALEDVLEEERTAESKEGGEGA